jgi:hypothetical protein
MSSGGTSSCTIVGRTERERTPWADDVGRKPLFSTEALMR